MLKKEKIAYYKEFKKELEGKDLVIFDYRGINVTDLTDMRVKIREQEGMLKIVKNSLFKRYAQEVGLKFEEELYTGMNAVVIVKNDYMGLGKVVLDKEKDGKVVIKAGLYEQKEIASDLVKTLANIPSRDVLYSMLVGGLQGVVSNLVYTLDEIAKQK